MRDTPAPRRSPVRAAAWAALVVAVAAVAGVVAARPAGREALVAGADSDAGEAAATTARPASSTTADTGPAASVPPNRVSEGGRPGWKTVTYRGLLAFEVPADWPVYDFDADPTVACWGLDIEHAVYLGLWDPSVDGRNLKRPCVAHAVGPVETVTVFSLADLERFEPEQRGYFGDPPLGPAELNGHRVVRHAIAPGTEERDLSVEYPDLGLLVYVIEATSPLGRQVVATIRPVGSGPAGGAQPPEPSTEQQ